MTIKVSAERWFITHGYMLPHSGLLIKNNDAFSANSRQISDQYTRKDGKTNVKTSIVLTLSKEIQIYAVIYYVC